MIILSKQAASAATDAVCDLLNNGSLKLFNDAGVLLAEPRFDSRAFKEAIDGLAESYPLEDDDNARASGEAKRFSACDTFGAVVYSGIVGDDMKIDNPHIAAGARVQVERATFSFPGSL